MLHLQINELPSELVAALETLSRAVRGYKEGEELFRAYYVSREHHSSAQTMGRSAGNIIAATRAGALVREAHDRNRDPASLNWNSTPPTGELPHPIQHLETKDEAPNDS